MTSAQTSTHSAARLSAFVPAGILALGAGGADRLGMFLGALFLLIAGPCARSILMLGLRGRR